MDHMRSEVRKWWRDFPERQLLTDLYKRAALRRAGCGTRYSRRRPCHSEGIRVASGLLADVPKPGRLDSEWESAAVSEVLAALLLPTRQPAESSTPLPLGTPGQTAVSTPTFEESLRSLTLCDRVRPGPRNPWTLANPSVAVHLSRPELGYLPQAL